MSVIDEMGLFADESFIVSLEAALQNKECGLRRGDLMQISPRSSPPLTPRPEIESSPQQPVTPPSKRKNQAKDHQPTQCLAKVVEYDHGSFAPKRGRSPLMERQLCQPQSPNASWESVRKHNRDLLLGAIRKVTQAKLKTEVLPEDVVSHFCLVIAKNEDTLFRTLPLEVYQAEIDKEVGKLSAQLGALFQAELGELVRRSLADDRDVPNKRCRWESPLDG